MNPRETTPSPGALRAAEATTAKCVANPPYYPRNKDERDREVLHNAEIIDRESGVRELLENLKLARYVINNVASGTHIRMNADWLDEIDAAIARHEGKDL